MSEKRATPVVRDATVSDIPALERCYPPASHAERVRTADGRSLRYLVVETGGQVAGFGRLVLLEPPGGGRLGLVPRIVNLNVRPDLRRRGLATALVRAMEDIARHAGHEFIHIGVSPDNVPARLLYRKLGYEPLEPQPPLRPPRRAHAAAGHRRAIFLGKRLR